MNLKLKSLLIGIFIIFLSTYNIFSISASQLSTQNQNLDQYITELETTQNQIFTLAQAIVFPSNTKNSINVNDAILRIDKNLNTINTRLVEELNSPFEANFTDRNILLIINAINYMKSSLYELKLLSTQETAPEKMITLEHYFNFRVYASNSIHFSNTLAALNE